MRTIAALGIVLSLALGMMVVNMSGYAAIVGSGDQKPDLASPDAVEEVGNNSSVQEGVEGSADNADDGDIVGLILGGSNQLGDILGLVTMLPTELVALGMPWYMAYPIGLLAQIVIFIGLLQAVLGRILR